jgi:pimeloyl-ACP methyl ester carboxylesterase
MLFTTVGCYYFCAVPAKSVPKGKTSRSRFKSRTSGLINEKFTILDDKRETQPYGNFSGLPYRLLKGEIWRPAKARSPSPLVIYNHGFMSFRREGLYLARHLASRGYTVAAVNFPLTGMSAPGKPLASDIINQPGDISCLIDYVLKRNASKEDAMYNAVAADKIAVAGVSYGALTSLLTTYHRELADPRIQATISIAGPTSMLTQEFFTRDNVPSLMIYGDTDSVVHYDEHALPILEKAPNTTLVTLKNGSHTGFSQPASTVLRFFKNPDSIACMMLRNAMDDKPWDFVTELGGEEMGIVQPHLDIEPLTRPLTRIAMKASRQHMFTALAAHAFLESQFADSANSRSHADHYLVNALPQENNTEVRVSR